MQRASTGAATLLIALSPTLATSQPTMGCSVPALACFSLVRRYSFAAVQSDLSGITYNPDSGTLFAVNNGESMVFELTLTGGLVASWKLDIADPEAITWLGGRRFGIPDENPSSVYEVELPAGGSAEPLSPTLVNTGFVQPPAGLNKGFEGLAYVPGRDRYYAAQEQDPAQIWAVSQSNATLAFDGPLAGVQSFGDLSRSCDSASELFALVKYPRHVRRISLQTGAEIERYAGAVCDLAQSEGLTFFQLPGSSKVTMIAAGEPYEVVVFEAEADCSLPLNSTTGDNFECPERPTGAAGCKRTLSEGGCSLSRCSKDLNAHEKVCEEGINACSLSECERICAASYTSDGGGGGGDGGSGAAAFRGCTHFAYDARESECYLFNGCIEPGPSEDYTTYALVDPTCEKVVEEFPAGCIDRRCSKDLNRNDKVCTDDSAETQCSLGGCKALCESHTPFRCTTYSYEAAAGECYVFDGCLGEGYEPGYSTYVLVDPTCDKSLGEGGCPNRLCSQRDNGWEMLCSGTEPGFDGCSLDECAAKCSSAQPACSHFAYDPVDLECLSFASCAAEGFNDDFTLYRYAAIAEDGGDLGLVLGLSIGLGGATILVLAAALYCFCCRAARSPPFADLADNPALAITGNNKL